MVENVVSPLCFLKLPENVIYEVLCNLEVNEAISFSLCSQKTKNLIHSLKQFKLENLKMRIGEEVKIDGIYNGLNCYFVFNKNRIPQIGRYSVSDMGHTEKMYLSVNFSKKFEWKKRGFDVRDWIQHLLFIFNQSSLVELHIASQSVVWTLDSLCRTIQGIEIHKLLISYLVTDYNFRRIMETVRSFRTIIMRRNPFENKLDLQKVLIQNLDCIKCHQLELDDILICNSLIFYCIVPNIKEKGLNRLLKLFIVGAMPRLKHLRFTSIKGRLQEENVMKGITYTVREPNVIRTFRETPASEEMNIEGGFDFERVDGTKTTVIISTNCFDIFVWD